MNTLLLVAVVMAASPRSVSSDPAGAGAAPSDSVDPQSSLRVLVRGVELAPRQQQAVSGAAKKVLGELTSFKVPAPDAVSRPCEDSACLQQQSSEESPIVISIVASVPSLVLELKGFVYDSGTGALVKKTVRGGNPDAPEEAVRTLFDALLPKWTRKGQASIAVRAPNDAVVKIDGRRVALTPLGDAVGVAAGVHDVDVLFKDGGAILFHRTLKEGARFTAQADPAGALADLEAATSARHSPAVRYVSYGLFGAGAVAIAGSLIAGGLSRGAANDLQPCDPADRSCLRIDQANAVEKRAQNYAQTGNVLLVTGAVLTAAGVGTFVFDVAGTR